MHCACSLAAATISLCTLQELYGDFQRTIEQMVKDKLEEKEVSSIGLVLPCTLHVLAGFLGSPPWKVIRYRVQFLPDGSQS